MELRNQLKEEEDVPPKPLNVDYKEKSGAPMRNLLCLELESAQSRKKLYSMKGSSPKR
jgi:hypothetical protein